MKKILQDQPNLNGVESDSLLSTAQRLQMAHVKFQAALMQMLALDLSSITDTNLRNFFILMMQTANAVPMANQQLCFSVNDMQTVIAGLINVLITKGVLTQEEMDVAQEVELNGLIEATKHATGQLMVAAPAPPSRRT